MQPPPGSGSLVFRHRLVTRVWHWFNAVTVIVMLMSGLMILTAHPRLYWGDYGANFDAAWLELGRAGSQIFPSWATIPSTYNLSGARRVHLTFAWLLAPGLLAYLVASLANRHIWRDLLPSRREISLRNLWHDIAAHARLRFPTGVAALRYNILQKLAYCGVLFLLLPAIILTGLAMSPAMDAAWPWLLMLFGGRQSARSIHFIAATLILAFLIVHLLMVLLAGPFNEMRSMITGRYRLPRETGR